MTCPTCAGRGEVIVVRVMIDARGREIVEHHAEVCSGCNGKGEV